MDSESRSESAPKKEPTPRKLENSGAASGAQNKEGAKSRPDQGHKDVDRSHGKEKSGDKKSPVGEETSEDRRKRAEKAKIIADDYDKAKTDSVRSAVRKRAEEFLETLGIKPKKLEKLSDNQVEDRVRVMSIAGGARVEDLPKEARDEINKLNLHREGDPAPETPHLDEILREYGGANPEQINDLNADPKDKIERVKLVVETIPTEEIRPQDQERERQQETERARQFGRRGEYQTPDLEESPPPEIGPEERQKAAELLTVVQQAYGDGKDSLTYRRDLISLLEPAVEQMTFLEAQALKEAVKNERGADEYEEQEIQKKNAPVLEVANRRIIKILENFEKTGNGDDIVKKSQDVLDRMKFQGTLPIDEFVADTDLAKDRVGEEEVYKGVRRHFFENASVNLQSAIKEEFITAPSDSQERIREKLNRKLDQFDDSQDDYFSQDPTRLVQTFIRRARESDPEFGKSLQKSYEARNTLHRIEVVNSSYGGNLEEAQKLWRGLGQQVRTTYSREDPNDPNSPLIKSEGWVSNLTEFLKDYPEAGRAFGQFVVEAERQLDEVDRAAAELRASKKKFNNEDIKALKRRVGWTDLLMSHSEDAEKVAKERVAETLGLSYDDTEEHSQDRASIDLAYRLYRTFTPGVFEKTWTFEKEGGTKYDRVSLDNKSPYFINLLENPIEWMRREARANPEMINEFERLFGREVFPHLKIGTRVFRKMAGGEEKPFIEGTVKVNEARSKGDQSFITERMGWAKRDEHGNLVVEGSDDQWRARLESLPGSEFSDDVFDDSIKERQFYVALQQHLQKMDDSSLADLLKALPSGKESRWKGALNVNKMIEHYIDSRRKYDKTLYDRDSVISTSEVERTINRMANAGYIAKEDAIKLKRKKLGIGVGKVRVPGYNVVRFSRKMLELGGVFLNGPAIITILLAGLFGLVKETAGQAGDQFKSQTGGGRH